MDDRGGAPADEAFWLLSDETRLAILRAVWNAPAEEVAFSDLRERVGNPDSGQFNYHLGKLRGHFLSKGDAGYRLTQAGREVVRAVLAGTLTDSPRMDSTEIDGTCVDCGGPLALSYDQHGVVECTECGRTVMWNEFPPAGLADRDPAAVAATFDRWTRTRFHLAMDGICPSCAAQMTTSIESDDEGVSTLYTCRNCKYEARVPLFGHVVEHPAVVSLYHDLGVDVTALPYWELRSLAREYTEQVVSTDPWRATVTIEADGHSLSLTLDAALTVVDVDRSRP